MVELMAKEAVQFKSVSCGEGHVLAVSTGGTVFMEGEDNFINQGRRSRSNKKAGRLLQPLELPGVAFKVATGARHSHVLVERPPIDIEMAHSTILEDIGMLYEEPDQADARLCPEIGYGGVYIHLAIIKVRCPPLADLISAELEKLVSPAESTDEDQGGYYGMMRDVPEVTLRGSNESFLKEWMSLIYTGDESTMMTIEDERLLAIVRQNATACNAEEKVSIAGWLPSKGASGVVRDLVKLRSSLLLEEKEGLEETELKTHVESSSAGDCIIITAEGPVPAHKAILVSRCPVLGAAFSGVMSESRSLQYPMEGDSEHLSLDLNLSLDLKPGIWNFNLNLT